MKYFLYLLLLVTSLVYAQGPAPIAAPGAITTWFSGQSYSTGNVVIQYGIAYQSLINSNTGNSPVANPSDWTTVVGSGSSVPSVFGRSGAVTANSGDYTVSQVTGAAPLASPALTGTPTAPTQSCATNTDIATQAYVANCAPGGSPGGSTTQVQYNSSGTFAGNSAFTFNSTNGTVTASGFATGTSTQGYLVLQQNSSSAPGQPANSFEFLAPTSGLTSSYSVTVPLLAPTAANSVMTVPSGGGQATWTVPAYASVANTFSAVQTISFTAGQNMLSLKAGGTNVAGIDMQGGGDRDWNIVAGAAEFDPDQLYFYDATTPNIDLVLSDSGLGIGSGQYLCWATTSTANLTSCNAGLFTPASTSGVIAFATGSGGNASAQLDFGSMFSTTSGNTDLVGRLTLSSGTASYTLLRTYTTSPACFANDENSTPTLATCVCTTTVCTVHGTGSDVVDFHTIGFN